MSAINILWDEAGPKGMAVAFNASLAQLGLESRETVRPYLPWTV